MADLIQFDFVSLLAGGNADDMWLHHTVDRPKVGVLEDASKLSGGQFFPRQQS
jgi:hypothetical protein